jgi:hypothetical protein
MSGKKQQNSRTAEIKENTFQYKTSFFAKVNDMTRIQGHGNCRNHF